jgi:DNA-binding response OmpR family regulator
MPSHAIGTALQDPSAAGPAAPQRRLHDWVSFPEARAYLGGLGVLVIDPDTEAGGRIFISLTQVGANVRLARRAVQGIRMLDELHPDLIIVGTALPDAEPVALIRQLRAAEVGKTARLVALGARDRRSERRRFLAACDGYLARPVDVRLFAQDLARALRGTASAPQAPPPGSLT